MPAVVFSFAAEGMAEIVAGINSIGKAAEQSASRTKKARATEESADKAYATKAIATAKAREEARWREVEKASAKIQSEMRKETAAAEREEAKRVKLSQLAQAKIADHRSKSIASYAATGIRFAAGAAAAGGAAVMGVIGVAVRDSMKVAELANRISVNARQAGQTSVDPRTLQREFEETARKTPGVKSEDIAKGVLNYTNLTGDLDTARKQQGIFATVAQATGADMQDVTTTAAGLSQKFDIKTVEEMGQAFATLMQQGKQGAMTLDQVAGQFARLSAAGQRFGFHGAKGVAQLGGLANLARTSTGSSEQASTAVEQMLGHLIQNAVKLRGQGVKVFDKKGQTRDITDVLVDTVSKVGGKNLAQKKIKLQELMGEEGVRALSPMMATYNDAFTAAKGDKKTDAQAAAIATAALREQLSQAINTTETWSGVQADAAQVQQATSSKVTAAWESVTAAVGKELVPALGQAIPKLLGLVPAIDPVIGIMSKLVDGASGLLKLLGFIPKVGTAGDQAKIAKEQADAAQATADEYRKRLEAADDKGAAPSQDELDKLQDLDDTAAALRDRSEIADAKAERAKPGQRMTDEEFAEQFAALGRDAGAGDTYAGDYAVTPEQDRQDALELAKRISQNPGGDFQSGGYSPDQQALVNARVDEEKTAPTDEAAASMSKMIAQMDGITASAIRAARALEQLGESGRTTPNSDR